MKSNLDLVNDCDQCPPDGSALYKFMVTGYDVGFGHLLERTVKAIAWPDYWEIDHARRTVKLLAGDDVDGRNELMDQTLQAERRRGTFKVLGAWHDELFPVYGPDKELVLSIERVAAPLCGVVAYGVQLLVYQEHADGLRIWIARRAKTKSNFPGMLDSTVGGSLPTGEGPLECLVRESAEEACLPEVLVRQHAVACGTVNYIHISDERMGGESGLICPEVQFTYEMRLPDDIIPVPGEDAVEGFKLLSVDELKVALARGEFTPANGCIVLDFFIRHGILTFENERDYVEIVARLHRKHDLQTV